MIPNVRLLLAVMALLCLLACGRRQSGEAFGPTGSSFGMMHDGRQREGRLFIPSAAAQGRPLPLVVALHGGAGDGPGMERATAFNRVAEREGFFVAYPSGVGRQWNDGRDLDTEAHGQNIDDTGFLVALVARLGRDHRLDPRRVYLTGLSNGGMMTYQLACTHTEVFAAYAPVINNMSEEMVARCQPTAPAPMMILNGTEDPLIPFDGGEIEVFGKKRGKIISAEATVAFWRQHNGCQEAPSRIERLDDQPDDGTSVNVEHYDVGCEGREVILHRIEGGGHTWPGGTQYLPQRRIGRVSRELVAEEVIWAFFAAHHR